MNSCDCIIKLESKYRGLAVTTSVVMDGGVAVFTFMPISATKNKKAVAVRPNFCAVCGVKLPAMPIEKSAENASIEPELANAK